MDLTGTAALVTGGASGAGAAAVRRLARAGAVVAICDRDEVGARALAEEVGGLALPGDVADLDTVTMAVDVAEDSFGRLNTVLLTAGGAAHRSGVQALDLAEYRDAVRAEVDRVVFGLTAAVPALRRANGGRIVVTTSLAALAPAPGDALRALTGHAVVGYLRAAAPVLAEERIVAGAVCADPDLVTADDVADAVWAVLQRGGAGECWVVLPGREPAPHLFAGVPGPEGSVAPALS